MIEHYQTLGIAPGASEHDIRLAFRRCAMQHHPDRNGSSPESQEKFKQCKAAYDALLAPAPPPRAAFGDLHDLFNSIFTGGAHGSQKTQSRGRDAIVTIQVSLLDIVTGRDLVIEVPSWQPCHECIHAPRAQACNACHGRGYTSVRVGPMSMRNDCPACAGRGTAPAHCVRCDNGIVYSTRKIKISVPAGIRPGMRLRIPGAGRAGVGPGACSGDLLVEVDVAEHPSFKRVDQDLHCQVEVLATVAALGGRAPVEWIDGAAREIVIPPGTRHGARIRIPGAGVPGFSGSSTGDLFCHVLLSMPDDLSARQKRLLKKFNDTLG